jgi:hypothetical protein
MHPAVTPAGLRRGDLHLLHDLAILGRALGAPRPPVRKRLERELGAELVRAVDAALAGPPAQLAA